MQSSVAYSIYKIIVQNPESYKEHLFIAEIRRGGKACRSLLSLQLPAD